MCPEMLRYQRVGKQILQVRLDFHSALISPLILLYFTAYHLFKKYKINSSLVWYLSLNHNRDMSA